MSNWAGIKVCTHCLSEFAANSPASKRCGSCILAFYRCQVCGKQKPHTSQRPLRFESASARFCSNRCAGIWKFQEHSVIQQALSSGRIRGCQHPAWQNRPQPNPKGQPRHDMRGSRNPHWRGGTSGPRQLEMGRWRYQAWRSAILRRDAFQCVLCGSNERLEANHIELWSEAPEKRYDERNGVTLCRPCHRSIRHHEWQFQERFKAWVGSRPQIDIAI